VLWNYWVFALLYLQIYHDLQDMVNNFKSGHLVMSDSDSSDCDADVRFNSGAMTDEQCKVLQANIEAFRDNLIVVDVVNYLDAHGVLYEHHVYRVSCRLCAPLKILLLS
jgi:hypothetical protein